MAQSENEALIEILRRLRNEGIDIAEDEVKQLVQRSRRIYNYHPKVGVLGKTGVGKSSLCNALFGSDVAEVSDVAACTREPAPYLVSLADEQGVALVDMPGVGESEDRDREYEALYRNLLPELDLVLWVVKADDRAYSVDQHFFRNVVRTHLSGLPFIVVVNQVDKVEPFRDWDESNNAPGPQQQENIQQKRLSVQEVFETPRQNVVPVSARERFGLTSLVERIISELPDEKKIGTLRSVEADAQSPEAEREAREGFFRSVKRIAGEIFDKHGDKIISGAITIAVAVITRRPPRI